MMSPRMYDIHIGIKTPKELMLSYTKVHEGPGYFWVTDANS